MNFEKNKNAEVFKIGSHMLSYCDSPIKVTFAMWDTQTDRWADPLIGIHGCIHICERIGNAK